MHDRQAAPATPGWVKVTGILAVTLLLFGGVHLIGRSLLGPAFGRHGDPALLSGAAEHGLQQP